jgi:long-chain acyl-CoA synthetase
MLPETVTHLTHHTARRLGDAPAFTNLSWDLIGFANLENRAGLFAGRLACLGIAPGDQVLIRLPNGLDWIIAMLVTWNRSSYVCSD